MKRALLHMLLVAVPLALTLGGGAGSASATVLCETETEPCTTSYPNGTSLEAGLKSGQSWLLKAGFANITCTASSLKGQVTNSGSTGSVTGSVSTFTLSGCGSATVDVLKIGTFSVSSPSEGSGTLTLEGFEVTTSVSGTSCVYGGPASFKLTKGSPATLKSTASLTKISGGFLCANPSALTAEYEVTTPKPLFVSQRSAAPILCKVEAGCEAPYVKGTTFVAGLKSGSAILYAGFATISCEEESIKGEVTNVGGSGTNVAGTITSLSFGKCGSSTVSVLKKGNFSLSSPSGGNGTLVLEGYEITVASSGTSCVYGGSISASFTGGTMASFTTDTHVAKVSGGFLCANPATWQGEYTVTAPQPLYVGNLEGAILCSTLSGCSANVYGKGAAIEASLKSGTSSVLKAGFATVTCEEAALKGEVTTVGAPGVDITGSVTSLTFGKCGSGSISVLKKGSFSIGSPSGSNGLLKLENLEVTASSGGTSCTYGGSVLASLTGGAMASIDITDSLPKLAGGATCANPAVWTVEYTVTAPEPLYVAGG